MIVWPVPDSYEKTLPAASAPGGFWENRGDRHHCGVDIYAARGSEVVALDEGLVLEVGRFTSPEQLVYWNVTYYVLIEHRGGLTAKYAEMEDAVVTAGGRVKGGAVVGHVGSVLDLARIDATAPTYIQRLAQNNHGSMLHLELYTTPPMTRDDYLGGNLFTGERPENLVDAGHYLRTGGFHRQAQPATRNHHPGSGRKGDIS